MSSKIIVLYPPNDISISDEEDTAVISEEWAQTQIHKSRAEEILGEFNVISDA